MRRLLLVISALLLVAPGAQATPRAVGDTTVFAKVPAPGLPEGIAVRNGIVYASTHLSVLGNAGAEASKVFAYDLATHALVRTYTITGQDTTKDHGLVGMTFGPDGFLYVLDQSVPAHVLRLDVATGAQTTYATILDIPSCLPGEVPLPSPSGCSPTTVDLKAYPDGIIFDAAGNAYVSDLEQATIWRIAPHGSEFKAWYQDARFDGVFGANGLAIDASGTKMYIAMTGSQQPATAALGLIYTLPLVDEPRPSQLATFHTFSDPAAGPDGIALGASGKLYVALAGGNQLAILNTDGTEALRAPDELTNQLMAVPYDTPASPAFDGKGSLLLTNQSYFTSTANNWVIFDIWVDDTAL